MNRLKINKNPALPSTAKPDSNNLIQTIIPDVPPSNGWQ